METVREAPMDEGLTDRSNVHGVAITHKMGGSAPPKADVGDPSRVDRE